MFLGEWEGLSLGGGGESALRFRNSGNYNVRTDCARAGSMEDCVFKKIEKRNTWARNETDIYASNGLRRARGREPQNRAKQKTRRQNRGKTVERTGAAD